jgi:hypothetical protein
MELMSYWYMICEWGERKKRRQLRALWHSLLFYLLVTCAPARFVSLEGGVVREFAHRLTVLPFKSIFTDHLKIVDFWIETKHNI